MSNQDLHKLLDAVVDEKTFGEFCQALMEERRIFEGGELTVDGFSGPWANNDIYGFLEAAIAWADDTGFGAELERPIFNPWEKFATFLWAGRSYE